MSHASGDGAAAAVVVLDVVYVAESAVLLCIFLLYSCVLYINNYTLQQVVNT